MKRRIFVSVGELSGDAYAARLIKELKKRDPDLEFTGVGGPKMSQEGVGLIADISHRSAVGALESIKVAPSVLSTLSKAKRFLSSQQIDLLIPIDFQGFNLPLMKHAHALKIPVIYFIPPQHWQWGSEKGGQEVVRLSHSLITIFKAGDDYYRSLGAETCFISHPLKDLLETGGIDQNIAANMDGDFNPHLPFISVFPGSRPQEIHYIYPVLLKAGIKFASERGFQLVVSVADPRFKDDLLRLTPKDDREKVSFYSGDSTALINQSQFSFSKSGTVTLQHALLNTPCVVAYKLSAFTYWIINMFFRHKLEKSLGFISLPNYLLGKEMFPELIQEHLTVDNLLVNARALLGDQYEQFQAQLHAFHDRIGAEREGIAKAADHILVSLEEMT